jgi:hypothetical protein
VVLAFQASYPEVRVQTMVTERMVDSLRHENPFDETAVLFNGFSPAYSLDERLGVQGRSALPGAD